MLVCKSRSKMVSYRRKLLNILFIMYFLMVFLIVVLFGTYMWNTELRQKEQYYVESLNGIKTQLDEMIHEMDVIASQIVINTDMQEILKRAGSSEYTDRNYFSYHLNDKKRAQSILWLFNTPVKRVYCINAIAGSSLVGLNPYVDTRQISVDYSADEWNIMPRSYKILPPSEDRWAKKAKNTKVISLLRKVVQTTTPFEEAGYIEVQQNCRKLDEICEKNGYSRIILLTDEQGNMLYSYGAADSIDNLPDHEEGRIFQYRPEKDPAQLGVDIRLENAPWHVLLLQNRSVMFSEMKGILLPVLIIFLAMLAAAVPIAYIASGWISAPIARLAEEASRVTLEDSSGLDNLEIEEDEFRVLKTVMSSMVGQLRESAMQLTIANESGLRQKIELLQSRINPHFLYNSLAAISAAGSEADSETVENMCFQLSELFRYVSEDDPPIVTLQEELDHVKLYLSFMKYRYEDSFSYEYTISGNTDGILMSRLVLQPFVENCFQHGFKEVCPPFYIRMSYSGDSAGWMFCIEDNGSGFPREILEMIRQKFRQIDETFSSGNGYQDLQANNMAMINSYIRLKYYFGNTIHIYIGNRTDDTGARIRIEFEKEQPENDTVRDTGR